MKLHLFLLLTLSLFFSKISFGQKEWSNWYINGHNLVTFKNGNTPQSINGFSPLAGGNNFSDITFAYSGNLGVSYADPLTGDMKFIVSGRFTYDKNYKVILSPDFLRACPGDKLSFHIIPFQNDPNKFYVVQYQDVQHDVEAAWSGLQVRCPNAIGLGYSVFDLSLNGGLGDYTQMNTVQESGTAWGVQLIRHANGKDVWVVTHDYGNDQFKAFLFSDGGVSNAVISSIGPAIPTNRRRVDGHFIASHDSKTVFVSLPESDAFYQIDFDNVTGKLSNSRKFNTTFDIYFPIYSPDDSKLYFYGGYLNPGIFQMDFNASDLLSSITLITGDPQTNYNDMGLGFDGKIYISRYSEFDPSINDQVTYLSVINCPNLPKYASNFNAKSLKVQSGGNFQPLINDIIKQPKSPTVGQFSLGNDTSICFGSYKISAPPGWQSYKWNTGETSSEIIVTKPGTYYVLAGDFGFSCPTAYGYVNITNAAVKLNLGVDTVLCPGKPYKISIPSSYTNIAWNDGSSVHNREISTNGNYSVKAMDLNGCITADSVSVSFKSLPIAAFGSDTVLCAGQTLSLKLLPPDISFYQASYKWNDGSLKDTLKVRSPGLYWGEVTHQGCKIRDTIMVSYVDAEAFDLGVDTTICTGETIELKTNIINGDYEWSTGERTGSIRVGSAGTYWVRVNNGSCIVTDTIKIKIQDKPVFDLGTDISICENETLVLESNVAGAKFTWQDGSINSSYRVKSQGQYKLTVNLNGCIVSDSVSVDFKPLPALMFGTDTSICLQQSLRLNANDPVVASYVWQDGSTASDFMVTRAGTYHLTKTGLNGCVSRDTILVNTIAIPQFDLGPDTSLCDKQQLRLKATVVNASYNWNNGSSGAELTVKTSGTYWLEVNQNGCRSRDSISVRYKPLPTVNLGRDTVLCEGVSRSLNALYDGATYTWHDQSTLASYEVRKAGSYQVAVDLNGCIARDTIIISYKTRPQFSLGRDTAICIGEELLLRPGISNVSYRWQNSTSSESYSVREPGIYSLTLTNECGSSFDEVLVTRGICKLYMPNTFTPNSDGVNDIFRVKDPGFISAIDLRVYNYFGELLFRSTDPRRGWDGTYKGVLQPNGNYVWQISITTVDGEKDYKKGTILLIR